MNPFPPAAIGHAGFSPAHLHHYYDLQRSVFVGKATSKDIETLYQYVGVLNNANRPSCHTVSMVGEVARESTPTAGVSSRQARPSGERFRPRPQSSKATIPPVEDPPRKRLRLSSIPRQDPVMAPADQARQRPPKSTDEFENRLLSTAADPPLQSTAVSPEPTGLLFSPSEFARLSQQPQDPVVSPISESKSNAITLNESSEPSLEPSLEPSQRDLKSPSTPALDSTTLDPDSASKPNPSRSSRVSLLAQTLLSTHETATQIPLSLDSLRCFLASLDPSLTSLAEPLHSSGVDSVEILGQFVAFEISTRIQMVVMACQAKDVEIKEEHLEALEAAIERAREMDWN